MLVQDQLRRKHYIIIFTRSQMPWDQVYEDLAEALEHHNQAMATTTDPDKRKMMVTEVEKVGIGVDEDMHS